jgi:ABC-type glycerol-3-phosphate transport system substrate-binding protein
MRALRSRNKWVAATAGVVVVGAFAAVAIASLPTNFTTTTLVTANLTDNAQMNSDRVKFQTKDPTDVRVQKVVIAPGGASGWHHHPGVVIVAVASGSVNVWGSDCSQTTYGPGLPNGSVFTESGDEPGQVTSTGGATTYATLIAPHADPPVFRIEDNPPPCAG